MRFIELGPQLPPPPELLALAGEASPELRAAMLMAMRSSQQTGCLSIAEQLLQDPDRWVRMQALDLVLGFQPPRCRWSTTWPTTSRRTPATAPWPGRCSTAAEP